jgi:outer membrane protein assembly factor BamB
MRKGQTKRLFYGLMMFLLCAAPLAAMDWYQYQGPDRDLISPESDWRTDWSENEPQIAWKKEMGFGFASIAIDDGRVYSMGNNNDTDYVWCYDAETGKEIWRHTYACPLHDKQHEGGPCGTPAVDGESVFTISKLGQMFCLNAKTGDVKWQKELTKELGVKPPTWFFAGSVMFEENDIVFDVGVIVRMDKKGKIVWKTKNYGTAYSTPVAFDLFGKRYIAAFPKYGLVILDAKTGEEFGKYEWDTRYGVNATTPVILDNKAFVSSGYNEGGALLEISKNGEIKQLWHNRLMRNQLNTSVLWKGHLYGFDERTLRCIDVKTGDEVWNSRGHGKGSLMLAGGQLIVLSENGELLIAPATPEGFTPTGRKQVLQGKCWTVPAFSDNKIYARNAAGDLICLDVSK